MASESSTVPTVFTEEGYRFKIYPNDHPPAHVHVQKAEKEARVRIDGLIEMLSNEGFNERELTIIMRLIHNHQGVLLAVWDTYHENR